MKKNVKKNYEKLKQLKESEKKGNLNTPRNDQ